MEFRPLVHLRVAPAVVSWMFRHKYRIGIAAAAAAAAVIGRPGHTGQSWYHRLRE